MRAIICNSTTAHNFTRTRKIFETFLTLPLFCFTTGATELDYYNRELNVRVTPNELQNDLRTYNLGS